MTRKLDTIHLGVEYKEVWFEGGKLRFLSFYLIRWLVRIKL